MPTPYALLAAGGPVRDAGKAELVALSRRLEQAALDTPPPVVAAALQDARFLTPRTRGVYEALAARGAQTTLFGRDLQSWVAPGVTGVALDDDDPLVDEWVVVLPSPTRPAVLAATDLRAACDTDAERSFSLALSSDRDLVDACLEALLEHAGPGGRPLGSSAPGR